METSPPRPPRDQLNEGSFAMSVDAPPLPSLPEGWSDLARRVDVMAVEQRVAALAHEIDELRAEKDHESGERRGELTSTFHDLRAEIRREIRSLHTLIVVSALSIFVGLAGLGFGFVQIALRA
jgi:hypothetical protein